MVAERGLLGQIEDDLLAGKPLADLLRKTIILGGRAGSTELRDWASHELNGFIGTATEDMPPHRIIMAPLLLDAVTGNTQVTGQNLASENLPDFASAITEQFPLRQGVGELEAWVQKGEMLCIQVPSAGVIGAHIDRASGNPYQKIYSIYWAISPLVVAGVIDKVRTSLAELMGELIVVIPADATPTPEQAAQALNVAVNGSKNRITVLANQNAGGELTAISSPEKEETGWWSRGRKIGAAFVGLATIIGTIVAVVGLP